MRDPGGRNAKNASEIPALAEKGSLPIQVLELDVTDDASVERAVDAAVVKAGRIDVAISNAATSRGWRKLSPPNNGGVLWVRIFMDRFA